MSEQVAGTIESIYTKTVKTSRGDAQVYHAMIDGNDVNLGFKHNYSVGETVNLPVEHKYGGYQLVQGGAPVPSTGAVGNAASSGTSASNRASAPRTGPAFPVATNTKDISIIRQSSLNRAVEVVDNMVALGLFTAQNEQEYLDKIFEVAYQFTDFGSGQREVKQAAAMTGYES